MLHAFAPMESSPVATPLENMANQYADGCFHSGSSSEGTPIVEVVMPRPDSPLIAKRKRVRTAISHASDWAKRARARCAVSCPASRLINQMAMSPRQQTMGSPVAPPPSTTVRSSGPVAPQKAHETHLATVRRTLRKLFTEYASRMSQTNIESTGRTSIDEVSTTNDDSFADWDQHQRGMLMTQASNELDRYLEESLIPRSDDFDILGWWKVNCTKWLILSCIARDVLTMPASTVPSESAFSTGERVVSDYRSRLSTETIEALICLHHWLRTADPCPEKITLQVVA